MGLCIFLIQNFSYFHTFMANPGLAREIPVERLRSGYRFCPMCKIYYDPEDTRHCCFCNACISGHDHHCPWTGKCIGRKTLYSFFSFIVFTFVLILYMFFALVFNNDKFK